jgi:predicted alpha/beta-hydrolase family hydrolase
LQAIEAGLTPRSVTRRDFPYRKEGRRAPDRAPKLIAAIRDEVDALVASGSTDPEDLVLGGRSMGGRMCSMAVAEGLPAAGLVLLSYPLHPPGKPDRLRTDHFGAIEVPCLFVSGTRDPFGTPDELEAHVEAIAGPVTIAWLEGQGHDPKGCDDTITSAVQAWLATL